MFQPVVNNGSFMPLLVSSVTAPAPLSLGVRLLMITFLPLCLARCYPARGMARITLFSLAATALYTLVIYAGFFTVFPQGIRHLCAGGPVQHGIAAGAI